MGVVAAFLLMKKPKDSVFEKTASDAPQIMQSQATAKSQPSILPDSAVRIPLPSPELPELSRDVIPMH